jgi:D-glycero-alpha-D-manno-heptose-7-phosphate kinase
VALSLAKFLSHTPLKASAPCRIDSGGTWDIKAMALPFSGMAPTTVNMALDMRTEVFLEPREEGGIGISSDGFEEQTSAGPENPLDSPFGLFYAAVSYFGFDGIRVYIRSGSPVKSALGGSSTALVALLKALGRASSATGGSKLSKGEILHLGYHLEDALAGGHCGLQDQAAAVYGGVHQWVWQFGNRKSPFVRHPLLDRKGAANLSERILVAFSGQCHVSATTNRKWIGDFLSGRTRSGWIEANRVVHLFAQALREQDWSRAARFLREEMALRREITPEALIPVTGRLIQQAEDAGCGARFAGAGAGGSLWAIGESGPIQHLKKTWKETLEGVPGGEVLDCAIDPSGVK